MSATDTESIPADGEALLSQAEYLKTNPQVGYDLFTIVDGCLQGILPGFDYHERYRDAKEVGLAMP